MLPCARQAKTLPLKGNKHYACANYPLCNNAANLDKHIKSKKWLQTMLDVATPNERIATIALCATCAQAPKCSHPGCPGHVGPSSRHAPHLQFCTLHYNDPCRVKDRDWAICRNARVGCRQLAVKSTGGLCFPCGEKRLPCKHALLGCLARVSYSSCRPPALQSMSATEPCAALKVCKPNHCPFQPNAPGACATPTCSTLVNSPKPSMCQLCQAGRPPCLQICGRRASADNGGLCHLCGPTPVHDDEICERPPAAPTATQPDSSHLPACSTPRCSNFSHDHSRCLFCIRSLWPCSTPSCKYRTPSAEDGFCLVCQPPEPCRLCATENCMNVVADIIDTLCIPCMAMCPPCSNADTCRGRAPPGQTGLCNNCLRQGDNTTRVRTPAKRALCAYASRGCKLAPQDPCTNVCRLCFARGPPRIHASHGCRARVRLLQPDVPCFRCAKGCIPCGGPKGRGCTNSNKRGGRRSQPDTPGLCARCYRTAHPVRASLLKQVRSLVARMKRREASQAQASGAASHPRCSVEWCCRPGLPVPSSAVKGTLACRLHRPWFQTKLPGANTSLRGFSSWVSRCGVHARCLCRPLGAVIRPFAFGLLYAFMSALQGVALRGRAGANRRSREPRSGFHTMLSQRPPGARAAHGPCSVTFEGAPPWGHVSGPPVLQIQYQVIQRSVGLRILHRGAPAQWRNTREDLAWPGTPCVRSPRPSVSPCRKPLY